ncbi:NAD(P)-dependent oxidoreductase [Bradyrhizobium diazoefficiens]|jgi:putative NADH-flavin reductase|nr:NAD(P)-dependent oxidoreductase [Bradyrhizobium diazoefficiens]UCF53979.1 MAG: NAD(P)-dependent oxidoreductase [Bradyrhizobium sp.]MBR0965934.1 NAD(P)-dependent oxidoreductase [Bradyrhizobium diazoefficiens]MBR0979558.1 NAD(P)-dependent oxidoreductase [Bradyrhizobium diazoefficiens]MBR1006539.1 NAD(P)-dependent oxidoreductase [Bradyrhizobium diazoefficiens]MBR1015354.1 NAD(P)-dependent oxidoreductase [Bradyrhizobium diazoefficiens]
MKIAVAGASGRAGSEITKELASRGHQVTAIARNPGKIANLANVTPTKGDVLDQAGLARLWAGHDVAVSSVHFLASDALKLIGAARDSKVGRYLVVGGAGSLEVAPGVKLVTTPGFPAQYKAEAEAGSAFLDLLRQEKDLNWTFISPSALFIEGERTAKFRLGADQLLADANGKSWITFADYAIALADEIERPAHERQRFTVGY